MAATRIEFQAVARAFHHPSRVSHFGCRAFASDEQGLEVLLIQSGMGPEKARVRTKKILEDSGWDLIISTGFAGALDTSRIGSVLIGEEVLREPSRTFLEPPSLPRIVCHPLWGQTALGLNWKGQEVLRAGKFVSVDRVLTHSEDKHALHLSTGAIGVDMESVAIGEVAKEHGLPFLIVRAISDGVNDDLPVDFNLFLKPSGWFSGVSHLLLTPKSWKGLWDLYKHSKNASWQLTQFFEEFFTAADVMQMLPITVMKKP